MKEKLSQVERHCEAVMALATAVHELSEDMLRGSTTGPTTAMQAGGGSKPSPNGRCFVCIGTNDWPTFYPDNIPEYKAPPTIDAVCHQLSQVTLNRRQGFPPANLCRGQVTKPEVYDSSMFSSDCRR